VGKATFMATKTRRFATLAARPRTLLLLWSTVLLGALIAAPLTASSGRAEGWFLYQAFAPFCHQQAQRCWQIQGYPLAVCARCFGVYVGLPLAALLGLRLPVRAIGIALALVGASWLLECTGLAASSAEVRFATGLVLGCSAGAVALACTPRRALPAVNTWRPPAPGKEAAPQ
jgi:uncharacterized membrane protein